MALTFIAILLVVVLGAGFAVRKLTYAPARAQRLSRPAETMAEYRTQQEIGNTELRVLPEWADCPCCGYPALDRGSDSYHICQLCDWEDTFDSEVLLRARENFRRYGTSYSPDEAAEWEGAPQSEDSIKAKRDFMAACDAVRAGRMDLAEWWQTVSAPK